MNLVNDDASPPVQKKANQPVVSTENHQTVFSIKNQRAATQKKTIYLLVALVVP